MTQRIDKVKITSLDPDLRGTFQENQRLVKVSGTVPGDVLDVVVTARSKHRPEDFGSILEVHERGEHFVAPPCRHAAPLRGRCGGCPAMHIARELRDRVRHETTEALLSELGVESTWHAAPEQWGYRNRSNFVAFERRGKVRLGSFAPRSNTPAPMTDCLVVRPAIAEVHREAEQIATESGLPVGPEALRWVSMREAAGRVVVELIVGAGEDAWVEQFAKALYALPAVQGVGVSVNEESTNAVRVEGTTMLFGEGLLTERYGAVDLQIEPGAFAQLNVAVASRMYEQAATWAGAAGVVWDFYCGIGGLGLNVATASGARLWGLESVETAVEGAQRNAGLAGVEARFDVVDLGSKAALEALEIPAAFGEPEVICVNPPRKGISAALRERLCGEWTGKRLIYMSCSPASFVRDGKALLAAGWRLRAVQAHDMLPITTHVELLGWFER